MLCVGYAEEKKEQKVCMCTYVFVQVSVYIRLVHVHMYVYVLTDVLRNTIQKYQSVFNQAASQVTT